MRIWPRRGASLGCRRPPFRSERNQSDHANTDEAEYNSSTDEKQSRGLRMSATRGGRRPGAGRKPGGRNKATIKREILARHGVELARNAGLMPIYVMLARMRGEPLPN